MPSAARPDDGGAPAFDAARLVRLLVAARRDGRRLAAADLPLPPDLAAAEAVQAAVVRALGVETPGVKVAIGPAGRPVAAPLVPFVEAAGGAPPCFAWRPGMLVEVEIAVRLGASLPPRPGGLYGREEVAAAVVAVHLGIEIIDSRLVEGGAAPLPLFLADALGNGGYVLGPALAGLPDLDADPPSLAIALDGAALFAGAARHPNGDPLAPLVALAGWAGARHGLAAGTVATTGSLCGVVALPRPGLLRASVAGLGTVEARFV